MEEKNNKPNDIAPFQSDRAHSRLSTLLQRRGIEGMDPQTEEGRYISAKIYEYSQMASPSLNPVAQEKLVRLAVEIELMKNSCLTTLLTLKPETATTDKARAKNEAFKAATGAYKGYVSLLLSIIKTLDSGDTAKNDTPETFEERRDRLRKEKGF